MRARSYQASPGPAKASALCISLWMIQTNLLVNHGVAVEERGCGKVDNRQGADLIQIAGPPAIHRRSEIPTAGLWSLLLQRRHAVDLLFSGVAYAQVRPELVTQSLTGPAGATASSWPDAQLRRSGTGLTLGKLGPYSGSRCRVRVPAVSAMALTRGGAYVDACLEQPKGGWVAARGCCTGRASTRSTPRRRPDR